MRCVDTHVHIWDLEKVHYAWLEGNSTILGRTYLIDELNPQIEEANVVEGVLVQAANTIRETEYMLDVALQTLWLKGVVGWMPLQQPEKVADIISTGYAHHPMFKGVRHLIHDEPDPAWLLQPAVVTSLRLLDHAEIPYEVVGILPEHLETVVRVLEHIPSMRLVIDHLNQPPQSGDAKLLRWQDLMRKISHSPNVYAKISGLGTIVDQGEDWNVENIRPAVAFVLEHFGTERCFCGGDWPVSLLAGSYGHTWNVYQQTLAKLLSAEEADKVLYSNAKSFYRL